MSGNGVTRKAGNKKTESGTSRFYRIRRWIYGLLLAFVIAAGIPMVSVPSLRHRLVTRVHGLKAAVFGETRPVMVQAGENQEPFPAEYERPLPPSVSRPFKFPAAPIVHERMPKEETPLREAPRRTLRIPSVAETSPTDDEAEASAEGMEPAPREETGNQPNYRQGTMEKAAYDLLLQSNPVLAGLARGENRDLQFVSWDAAGRGDDVFWVRLKFRQEGKQEAEYIWQVRLESKSIAPLNYNARTLP